MIESSQSYIIISVIVLLAIMALVLFMKKKNKNEKLTPLAGVAFAFIIGGIVFGDNRLIGYSLLGIGVLLSVIDIVRKRNKRR